MRPLLALLTTLLLGAAAPAQTLLWEADFAAGLGDWFAAHSSQVSHADGAMVIDVTGHDPYVHASRGHTFDLAANPRQFIRIRLRTNASGSGSFYYADTTEGRDAGFVGEKHVAFATVGDDAWREVDVYPRWQDRVTRLRFDPPGNDPGQQTVVSRIAVYEWPTSQQQGPRWDLRGDHGNWLPHGGTRLQINPDGLLLTGPNPQLLTELQALPEQPTWLTVEARTGSVGRLQVLWRTLPAPWQRAEVPLRPGATRYALRLDRAAQAPQAGDLMMLSAVYAEPSSLEVTAVSLAATPLGAPLLDVAEASLDRALSTVDEPVGLRLAVRNIGGEPLAAGSLSVDGLPDAIPFPELAPGAAVTLDHPTRFSTAGRHQLVVDPAGAAITLSVDVTTPLPGELPPGAAVGTSGVALTGKRIRLRGGWAGPDRELLGLVLEVQEGTQWRRVGSLPALAAPLLTSAAEHRVTATVADGALVCRANGPIAGEARYRLDGPDQIAVTVTWQAATTTAYRRLPGVWLRAGDGGGGSAKREGLFPGIEYLGSDIGPTEGSSSDRDTAPPGDLRVVPHRHNICIPMQAVELADGDLVALLWNVDSQGVGPAAAYASPNFAEGADAARFGLDAFSGENHLLATFWPPTPEGTPVNAFGAEEPIALPAGEQVVLSGRLLARAGAGVLNAVDAWIEVHQPAPAGRVLDLLPTTLRLSRTAFEEVLWQEGRGWYSIPSRDQIGPPDGVAILYRYLAWLLDDDSLLAKAKERVPRTTNLSLALHQGNLAASLRQQQSGAARTLAGRGADGRWTFQPDEQRASLGARGDTNIGIEAPPVTSLLAGARVAADEQLLTVALEAAASLRRYRVPRGAQVWEVPLHCPDILASGRACDVYTLAYELTGDRAWLDDAEYWARTALPFIYHWQHPRPDLAPMRGGSIPVFGATFFTNEWFGRLVQWNGLEVAASLHHLSQVGGSSRWAAVAEDLTVSAQRQQWPDPDAKHVGLYPDYWNMRTGIPDFWLSCKRVLDLTLLRLGETPRGDWRTLWVDGQLVSLASPTPILGLRAVSDGLPRAVPRAGGRFTGPIDMELTVNYPLDASSFLTVVGVERPAAVLVDGEALPPSTDEPQGAGWQYVPDCAAIVIRLDHSVDPRHQVRIEGLSAGERQAGGERAWSFAGSRLGWGEVANDCQVTALPQSLRIEASGGDPYLVGPPISVRAEDSAAVVVRAKVSVAGPMQLYFATNNGGFSAEQQVRSQPIPADGQFHDVRIEAAAHPLWRGLITLLRLDPPGTAGSVCEIESVRLAE